LSSLLVFSPVHIARETWRLRGLDLSRFATCLFHTEALGTGELFGTWKSKVNHLFDGKPVVALCDGRRREGGRERERERDDESERE
jgi:hypothetical protein